MKIVRVKKEAAKRVLSFFPWIYRNEIEGALTYEPGELVRIESDKKFLGIGYINPKSVISIRILTFKDEPIDGVFFRKRIEAALQKRRNISSNALRLVHSEADMLPGLIADRYGDYLSVHLTTAGMVRLRDYVIGALEGLQPEGMVIEGENLQKEGIAFERQIIRSVPDEVIVEENGLRFVADLIEGQKTGLFLDQRRNRSIVAGYVKKGDRFLDLFCNTGGFALYAARAGAKVEAVDISQKALEQTRRNFELNGLDGEFICQNAFDYLRALRAKKERYDLIVLDPPSFAKHKSQKAGALRGFKDLLVNAFKIAAVGGKVAIFSCSYYVEEADLLELSLKASKDTRRRARVLEVLYQDQDHPWVVNVPYSKYLKGFLFEVE